ncbi:hypothetical protein M3223_12640 [Paenibacillus pasadenensis]|uniref:hypothetical protein n=1 Tax=Paenibacillus pasadenensis TaxID=217090 RepID=UPI00203D8EC2|nr:hypothetical protein [Paenibacillus pasadenensis]MCM3748202.1 hypothetical protein [Paenibacillus pasadenensis]
MSLVYASIQNNNTVSVIDTESDEIAEVIPVGNNPVQINVSADGTRLFAANGGARSISVISASTNQVIRMLRDVGSEPFGCVQAQGKLFVPDHFSGYVTVLNARTGRAVQKIPVASRLLNAVTDTAGRKLYVTSLVRNIWIIDTLRSKLQASIPAGATWGLAFSPNGRRLFVNHYVSNQTAIYNAGTNQLLKRIPVGLGPIGIALSNDGKRAYVTNSRSGTVSVIQLAACRVIKTIPVGRLPYGAVITRDDRKIYVTNYGADTISVIDSERLHVSRTITVGPGPRGLVII